MPSSRRNGSYGRLPDLLANIMTDVGRAVRTSRNDHYVALAPPWRVQRDRVVAARVF
jgi:hypothetical protein